MGYGYIRVGEACSQHAYEVLLAAQKAYVNAKIDLDFICVDAQAF